jgi:hypothetical protein
MMKQADVVITNDGILLKMSDGVLPSGMSTFEAKKYAVNQYFGSLLTEVRRLSELSDRELALSQIVLTVREALELR